MKLQRIIITTILIVIFPLNAYASIFSLSSFSKNIKANLKSHIKSNIVSLRWVSKERKIYNMNNNGLVKSSNIEAKFASTKVELPKSKILDIAFTSQAPRGNWVLPYSEACEEASLIMVEAYLNNKTFKVDTVEEDVKKLVAWETSKGYAVDIGTDAISDVIKNFYNMDYQVFKGEDVSEQRIKELINIGNPIIVPVAGQKLGNINYIGAGPPYHVLIITGYDDQYFYTHDPGTRNGKNYKYEINLFLDAIHDWNGSKNTVLEGEKKFIIMK